ncbi:MAG: flagellar motor switch protein FliM [Lachnospiraceae bacterium]|nr:flagellar motor switch protein FliM [Ruminococcus sp.]MCM1273844.1 flagellar motor switch protein FliM [Lachnospiraceae bacterium]
MADVLTQAQIDEMLKGIAMGAEPVVTQTEEAKVKEYDFRAPKKFTKEQIKVLESIFENYARLLSSYLTGKLRLYCRVSLINIEEQRYNEFNNALPDYVIMGMVDLGIKNDEISETDVIVQVSNPVTYTMIDRLLGGKGEYSDTSRDFTEIEITIMTDVMRSFSDLLKEPWMTHIDLEPRLIGIETNSRVVQTIGHEDTVIIVALEVEINNQKSIISVCIPAINLDEIMGKFIPRYSGTRRKTDAAREAERRDSIMSGISTTDLVVKAVLGEINLDMYEVLTLQVNDVIPLDKKISENIIVRVGERDWCDGKLGTYNNKKAIMIENFIEN